MYHDYFSHSSFWFSQDKLRYMGEVMYTTLKKGCCLEIDFLCTLRLSS